MSNLRSCLKVTTPKCVESKGYESKGAESDGAKPKADRRVSFPETSVVSSELIYDRDVEFASDEEVKSANISNGAITSGEYIVESAPVTATVSVSNIGRDVERDTAVKHVAESDDSKSVRPKLGGN